MYFYESYLKPFAIDGPNLAFQKMSVISQEQKEELAKIYCTLFNQDKKQLIKELGVKGRSSDEGLWNGTPYTLESGLDLLNDYTTNDYFGICALALKNTEYIPIGATVYQLRTRAHLESKGYQIPFEIPENTEFWCAIDTFRVDVTCNGSPLKHVATIMRHEVIKTFKQNNAILLYSSSNNPVMVKSWQSDGFTVVEKNTTFGNRFQSFKLID